MSVLKQWGCIRPPVNLNEVFKREREERKAMTAWQRKKQIKQAEAERAAEWAEDQERERLHQEQQAALGNAPRSKPGLPRFDEEDDDRSYGDGRVGINLRSDHMDLTVSDDQWIVARWLVRHGYMTSLKNLNVYFEKPPSSDWAKKVVALMIKQQEIVNGSEELNRIIADVQFRVRESSS